MCLCGQAAILRDVIKYLCRCHWEGIFISVVTCMPGYTPNIGPHKILTDGAAHDHHSLWGCP
jgi:hypothetical protein